MQPRSSPRKKTSPPLPLLNANSENNNYSFSTPRKSPTNLNSTRHHQHHDPDHSWLLKLVGIAILSVALLFTAKENHRLRYDNFALASSSNNQQQRSSSSHAGDVNDSDSPSYSILPKKIYSVIGLESSGTQFVSKIIEDALQTGPYREGSAPCNVPKCENASNELQCIAMVGIADAHACDESNRDVQVQHFSLPWGGSCHQFPNPPVVDVVLPPQCTRDQADKIEIKECNAMSSEIWDIDLNGNAVIYPVRYQLDIVKMKQWYDAQGVEHVVVVVVRDEKISYAARYNHCNNATLRNQEEEVGTKLIVDAINTFILGDEEEKNKVTSETIQHWAARQYQQEEDDNDGRNSQRRRLSNAMPSGNNVVVVSYETLVKLGSTYVRMLYNELGIESDVIPDIQNSNEKYLNTSWT